MWYKVRATKDGYELVLETGNSTNRRIQVLKERGGHGPVEQLYALAEKTWNGHRVAKSQGIKDKHARL